MPRTRTVSAEQLPDDWSDALRKQRYNAGDAAALAAELCGPRVWPERRLVFRAFHDTRLDHVQAVILGQDPYSQPHKATGLAFSQDAKPTTGDSLDLLFTSMETDRDLAFRRPLSGVGDLSPWAQRGVLLLNSALTVAENTPGSHRSRWREFTRQILGVLSARTRPTPFLLLGTSTPRWLPVSIPDPPHRRLPTAHPVAWHATNVPLLGRARPFSKANKFLTSANLQQIDWRL